MNRSMSFVVVLGSALLAAPVFAQQPLEPGPPAPPPPPPSSYEMQQNYGQPAAQPQMDPSGQAPVDPYAAAAGDEDDEDEGYDVTYDISTDSADAQQYDDGYDPNAYQQFESTLSPYGSWEDVPQYGHVWVPSASVVGYDFSPYATGGRWVDSEYGWTWTSDWDWGWAPFHYGRWMVMGGRGWCWLPGTVWGPAWVHWRFGGGYAGWAPMGPRGVVVGAPRGTRGPWRFTVAGQLGMPHPAYLPARVIPSVWSRTAVVHNVATVSVGGVGVRINAGPPAHQVAAAIGRPVVPVRLGSVAPRTLPRTVIAPRLGTPIGTRPWLQSRPIGGVYGRPVAGARTLGAPPAYRAPQAGGYRPAYAPAPTYRPVAAQPYHYAQQPVYRAPAPAYHYPAPAYRSGTLTVVPSYQQHVAPPPPAYHYSAPAPAYRYSAPAPAFHSAAPAPAFHSAPPAPVFHSAPPAFHGGGGGGHHR